jgi:hypothetical protein
MKKKAEPTKNRQAASDAQDRVWEAYKDFKAMAEGEVKDVLAARKKPLDLGDSMAMMEGSTVVLHRVKPDGIIVYSYECDRETHEAMAGDFDSFVDVALHILECAKR